MHFEETPTTMIHKQITLYEHFTVATTRMQELEHVVAGSKDAKELKELTRLVNEYASKRYG